MILLRWLYIGENSRVSVRVGWLQYFSTTRTWTRCQDSAGDSAPPILEDDSRDLCQVNVGRQAENPGMFLELLFSQRTPPLIGSGLVEQGQQTAGKLPVIWKMGIAAEGFKMMVARDGAEPPPPAFSELRYAVANDLTDSGWPPKSLRSRARQTNRGFEISPGKFSGLFRRAQRLGVLVNHFTRTDS